MSVYGGYGYRVAKSERIEFVKGGVGVARFVNLIHYEYDRLA
jgi:hypothetical protein